MEPASQQQPIVPNSRKLLAVGINYTRNNDKGEPQILSAKAQSELSDSPDQMISKLKLQVTDAEKICKIFKEKCDFKTIKQLKFDGLYRETFRSTFMEQIYTMNNCSDPAAVNPHILNVIFVGGHGFVHPINGDTIVVFHEYMRKEQQDILRFVNLDDIARMLARNKFMYTLFIVSTCREKFQKDKKQALEELISEYTIYKSQLPSEYEGLGPVDKTKVIQMRQQLINFQEE
ncbi:hypothetical protein FGO68_gene6234 [Halteria grandinella]|uniref:Uncharacterized protein n=1 Tax=Halteria grandinella TaxID=5974 RepID=A0A8J8T5R2_HALGN|nr:hypothetical protein FGO68_gene6234 [Halteria grandinella]